MLRLGFRAAAFWALLSAALCAQAPAPSPLSEETAVEDDSAGAPDTAASIPSPVATVPVSRPEEKAVRDAWRKSVLAFRAGRYAEAAKRLQAAHSDEPLAEAYRASFFAQACLLGGMKRAADSALDSTLQWVKGAVWQRHFLRLRMASFDPQAFSPEALKAFCRRVVLAPVDAGIKAEVLYPLLRLDSVSLPDSERLIATRQLIRFANREPRLDSAYQAFAQNPARRGTWEEQKVLRDWEIRLGYTQKALERGEALAALAPDKSAKQALQWSDAGLRMSKGGYPDATKAYRQYQERYGDSPDLFLQLARSYRGLKDEPNARLWYGWLAEKYPRHAKTSEVLWMWAFDDEMDGKSVEAVERYSRLASDFAGTKRGEWALFRAGWTYYKRGDWLAAVESLRRLRNGNSSSPQTSAALYWEARSQDALRDSLAARSLRVELCARFSLSFYGHLARVELAAKRALPDSLQWKKRMASADAGSVKTWMREKAPGFQEYSGFPDESRMLPLSQLMEWRLDTLVSLTLGSLPAADFKNPWALYVYARKCQSLGLWRDASRLAGRLADILPFGDWGSAPRSVLRVLYPMVYPDVAKRYALRAGLPPELVLAVMKQESGFDAKAVSRAGARGLLQIMPSTGNLQARREDLPGFNPDMLFDPAVNLRLGAAFLRDLKARHQGNLYAMLSHYNAGPVATGRWLARVAGRPMEEAVEDLEFGETREYVKKVLANYWTYQALGE